MATPHYIIGGLFVYLVVGLLFLGWRSRKAPALWPMPDVAGLFVLLLWPVLLLVGLVMREPTPTPNPTPTTPAVQVGATGTVVSELRPFGQIEIAGTTHEAKAEHGTIAVGVTVQVVRVEQVAVVRKL